MFKISEDERPALLVSVNFMSKDFFKIPSEFSAKTYETTEKICT